MISSLQSLTIVSQKLSWLCLLDLSAAFDTIGHSINARLSSLVRNSVLNWFNSHHPVLSASNVTKTCLPLIYSSCGVSQDETRYITVGIATTKCV